MRAAGSATTGAPARSNCSRRWPGWAAATSPRRSTRPPDVYEGTVALAAERATADDVAELHRLAGRVEEAVAGGDVAEISEADRAFQQAVAASARSVALELMVSNFYRSMDLALDAQGRVKRSTAQMMIELRRSGRALPHRRLAEAIAAGDVTRAQSIAAQVMTATGQQATRRTRR